MRNVIFSDSSGLYVESYRELGLVLSSREISSPKPKRLLVEIEGMDGALDITDALGDPRYKTRQMKLVFTSTAPTELFWETFSEAQNLLHGKRVKISFDDDPGFYYLGNVAIDKWTTQKSIGSMTFTIECDPFKYKKRMTVVTADISTSGAVRLYNNRMPVFPSVVVSHAMTMAKGDDTYQLTPGQTFTDLSFSLKQGITDLTFTGTGTVTITYQEGSF